MKVIAKLKKRVGEYARRIADRWSPKNDYYAPPLSLPPSVIHRTGTLVSIKAKHTITPIEAWQRTMEEQLNHREMVQRDLLHSIILKMHSKGLVKFSTTNYEPDGTYTYYAEVYVANPKNIGYEDIRNVCGDRLVY